MPYEERLVCLHSHYPPNNRNLPPVPPLHTTPPPVPLIYQLTSCIFHTQNLSQPQGHHLYFRTSSMDSFPTFHTQYCIGHYSLLTNTTWIYLTYRQSLPLLFSPRFIFSPLLSNAFFHFQNFSLSPSIILLVRSILNSLKLE